MSLTQETLQNMSFNDVNNRMLFQFRNKEKINAFLYSVWKQEDAIKNAVLSLNNRYDIDHCYGGQLDMIGNIIGQSRVIMNVYKNPYFGFEGMFKARTFEDGRFKNSDDSEGDALILDDEYYRKVLKAKILKRNSQATIEDTIESLKASFNIDRADVKNAGNAKINIYLTKAITQFDILLCKQLDLLILASGVDIYSIYIAPEEFFGFDDLKGATGFGQAPFYAEHRLENSYGMAEVDGDKNTAKFFGFFGQTDAGGFGLPFNDDIK